MRSVGRRLLLLVLFSCGVGVWTARVWAQEAVATKQQRAAGVSQQSTGGAAAAKADDADDDGDEASSFLTVAITVDAGGRANVVASYYLADGTKLPPAEIKYALQAALTCTLEEPEHYRPSASFYSGFCRPEFASRGLLREGRIATGPITGFAARHEIAAPSIELRLPDYEMLETVPAVRRTEFPNPAASFHPKGNSLLDSLWKAQVSAAVRHRAAEALRTRMRTLFVFATFPDKPLPAEIMFHYGYTARTMQRASWILGLVLAAPILLFVWLSRKALAADVADKAVVWFSYMRSLGWILNGTLLAWWVALEYCHAEQILSLLAGATPLAGFATHPVFFEAAGWIPPAVIWLVCYRISHPVQQKLRGLQWTKGELTLQALYSTMVQLFPLAMFLTGLRVMTVDGFRATLVWWISAFVLRLTAARALLKLTGMTPQALSTGDLRDRAFAMAERMGVKLQQVYLIPSGKGQLANAFARTGNTIAFTDYLLKRMSQREVDYVLGHELTHLKLKHPKKLGYAVMFGVFVGVFASSFVVPFLNNSIAGRYALLFVIISVLPYFFSRRFEYAADAGAVAVTGDARAAISALFKLSELNMMPIHWSRWREKWLTHPSSLRRARAIAKKAGIAYEEIPRIATEGAAETQSYAIPGHAVAGGKIHSTQYTKSLAGKLALILIALLALVPSLISLGAMQVVAPWKWLAFGAAAPVTFSAILLFANYGVRFAGRMGEALSRKLAGEGVQTKSWNGVYVSLAPSAAPRFYDGGTYWDIGYLFFYPDRICYWGEETKFALRPQQITAIKLADGMPGLLRTTRVYVAWKDEERGTCGVFNVGCGGSRSVGEAQRMNLQLTQRLQAWWKTPPVTRPLPGAMAALGSPQMRAVTSKSPAERWRPRRVWNELVWSGILAAVGGVLCGLPFHLTAFFTTKMYAGAFAQARMAQWASTPGAGWYVVAVAMAVRLAMFVPYLRYRDVPVLVAEAGKVGAVAGAAREKAAEELKVKS